MPASVVGCRFDLYLILDLYSRRVVGWEVNANDSSDHAVHLARSTALADGIADLVVKTALNGDGCSTLKATTVLAVLDWLGMKPSYSRPRVGDDNAYAESLFPYCKISTIVHCQRLCNAGGGAEVGICIRALVNHQFELTLRSWALKYVCVPALPYLVGIWILRYPWLA